MGGVEGGVATEGPVILSDLFNTLSPFTIPPLAGVQSGHMGNIRSRSVPLNETKDTTCMLMHCEAFREGSAAEAGGWSVPFLWRSPGGCKTLAEAKKNWFWPLFYQRLEREETRKILSVPVYGGEGAVKLIFSLFKAAKGRDNKSNLDEWLWVGAGEKRKGTGSKIHFKSLC